MIATNKSELTRVGKYRILRELGRGGMGVVYLAEDTRLQREVALKLLHPALTLDRGFVDRFATEARAIAALTHPGIVRVHAFEEVDGCHLIDMEYVDGRSLDQVIARGPVSGKDTLNIIARVLEALAACHARGMVHRDIKPSNILIGYDGRILLSDFGLAMSFALASTSGATSSCFIGTPKYAPPESWDRVLPSPAGIGSESVASESGGSESGGSEMCVGSFSIELIPRAHSGARHQGPRLRNHCLSRP